MIGAKEWALEIDKAWLETQDDMRDAVVVLGLTANNLIDAKSPVDTGRFRGNWSLAIGAPDTSVTATVDPSGGATVARNANAMMAYPEKAWPPVYITNNLPYAERLEDGYSKQAPGGMVALTYAELAAIWEKTTI